MLEETEVRSFTEEALTEGGQPAHPPPAFPVEQPFAEPAGLRFVQAQPEVFRSHVLQVVGLVKDHMLIRGSTKRSSSKSWCLPDRQVGAEQVMVADDDLRVKSRFTGLYPETLLLVGAVAPETGLRLRNH